MMAKYDRIDFAGRALLSTPPPDLVVGKWIRWTTPDRIFEGEIVALAFPSMVLHFVGQEAEIRKVFPLGIPSYFPPDGTGMEIIDKPRTAGQIERDAQKGKMSVKRASALLGVEPKRVRAMLRGGQIRGGQVDGKWSYVNGEDVMARLR
jgi:hypothetical protein